MLKKVYMLLLSSLAVSTVTISSATSNNCELSIYATQHPEECLSKTELQTYRKHESEYARESSHRIKLINNKAPQLSLIKSIIEKCELDYQHLEIFNAPLKVHIDYNNSDVPSSQADVTVQPPVPFPGSEAILAAILAGGTPALPGGG